MDCRQRPVRGSRLPILVPTDSSAADILNHARKKFKSHDRNFCDDDNTLVLRYPDGTPVYTLPENDELFDLKSYKEQIMKEYNRIIFYVTAES